MPLACGEGARALVADFLSALASEAECRRTSIGDRLAHNAADLLAVLVTEWTLEQGGAFRDAYGMSPSEWQRAG